VFSGCRSKVMAISDAAGGHLITTLPIGGAVDANAYDPTTGYAFASNGDGTLTVVGERERSGTFSKDAQHKFHVAQTVQTAPGARTMALDPKTHVIYLVTAKFGPTPKDSTAANPRRRPPMIPGTFEVIVVSR
jgi:hypothetical protein